MSTLAREAIGVVAGQRGSRCRRWPERQQMSTLAFVAASDVAHLSQSRCASFFPFLKRIFRCAQLDHVGACETTEASLLLIDTAGCDCDEDSADAGARRTHK
eukprot:3642773-Pleurochrysis_carterae.AAC.1